MVLTPIIWAVTGKNAIDEWIDGPLEPFTLMERIKEHDDA